MDVLDTDDQVELDRLAEAAAAIFDAPIALISLVDAERQWFKARCGLSTRETTRAVSFCAHAIMAEEEIFAVPDARGDPRFDDNPLVVGPPFIGGYIGARLTTADGFSLGTLCVIDHRPIDAGPGQINALLVLRDQAMRHLSLRRRAAEAEQARDDAGLRISVVSERMDSLLQQIGSAIYGVKDVDEIQRLMRHEIRHMQQVLDDWERPLGGGDVTV